MSRLARRRRPLGAAPVRVIGALVAWAVASGGDPASSARAQEPVSYRVDARIDAQDRLLVVTQVRVRPRGAQSLNLWLHADRLAQAPEGLDDLSAGWLFPREIDGSPVTVDAVRVDGRPARFRRTLPPGSPGRGRSGSDLVIDLPDPRAREVVVTLHTRQRVPERFGRLGLAAERIALLGPWYPLLTRGDVWAFAVPHRLRVELPRPYRDLVSGVPLRRRHGVWEGEGIAAYVPLMAMRRGHRESITVTAGGQSLRLHVIGPDALYRSPPADVEPTAGLRDLARVDVTGRVGRVVEGALRTLARVGLTPARRSLKVILAPSRTELVAAMPGLVAVSDRIYEVLPLDHLTALHDRVLVRAVFRALLEESDEPVADRDWALDMRAVLLADLDTLRRQGELTTARDLIDWAGFHPSVDQLLYAPQIAFVDTYFGTVAEPDRFGEDPARSRRPRARGRRLLEHARDRVAEERFDRLATRLIQTRRPARALLEEAGVDEATLAGWIGSPGRPVNYRLGSLESERTPEGWAHRVEVIREGAERPEPVEVRLVDDEGNVAEAVWEGTAGRGTVTLRTPAPRAQVWIDPRRRLPQSAEIAEGHPLADDTDVLPFRPPIIQALNVAVGATEGTLLGVLDLVVRRQYDLEHTWGLGLRTGPRATGGILRYIQLFGRKRDGNNRVGAASLGLTFDRLHEGFSVGGEGGWRTGLVLSAGFSTLRYFLDPHRGARLFGNLQYGLTRRDGGRITHTLAPSVRGSVVLPIGLRHVLTLVADVGWVFGDPLPSERPGLGGRFLLRGYQSDELVGEGRAMLVAEHRFTPTVFGDLAIDLFHLVWVRRIQLALFAGVGLVYEADDGRQLAAAAEVGGGIRFHFEYGGIQPGVLSLDLARPLIRTAQADAARAPVTFVFGFEQYF